MLCEVCFNLADEPRCRVCTDERRDRRPDLRGRGAERRDPGGAHPRVPRRLPRARRRALADRRRSTPRTCGSLSCSRASARRPPTVREVVLATNPTTTGEATALHIAAGLRERSPAVTVSRLASGLPVGADLEYADEVTLGQGVLRASHGLSPWTGPIVTPFGFDSTAAEVVDGDRPDRQARDRHRRLVGHRRRDGAGAGRRRRRGDAGRARPRGRRARGRRHHRRDRQRRGRRRRGSTSPTRRRSTRSSARWSGPLHLLVNNAGVMALPELQLTPTAGSCSSRPTTSATSRSRSACTTRSPPPATRGSSRSARAGTCARRSSSRTSTSLARPYDPWLAYGQSKTANVLFAVEATRRWAWRRASPPTRSIPGGIADTNLSRHMDPEALARLRAARARSGSRRSSRARRRACCVATSPQLDGHRRPLLRGLQRGRGRRPGRRGPQPLPTASPPTRSTPTTPRGCGTCRWRGGRVGAWVDAGPASGGGRLGGRLAGGRLAGAGVWGALGGGGRRQGGLITLGWRECGGCDPGVARMRRM